MLEGIIKYQQKYTYKENISWPDIHQLEICRRQLRLHNLIGEDPVLGLGHGNLSARCGPDHSFIITGTQTGKFMNLEPQHYTKVVSCNVATLEVTVEGPIMASSEALTHGALYLVSPQIQFVAHIHHRQMWEQMLQRDFKRTAPEIEYGTYEMATAIAQLVTQATDILVMAGHPDGIIFFGPQLAPLTNQILTLHQQFSC